MSTRNYDVIIVGAGAGGGIVAGVLAEAGHHVLLLERGPHLRFNDVPRDHLRSQRLSLYGHNAGPHIDGNPRVVVNAAGREAVVRPHEGGYHNNAACVGGGTRVYGAQAWRFMPQDFRMATLYGVPDGSSLADWPLSYEDLAPYYTRAEWEIGVAGDSDAIQVQAPGTTPYPMPPVPPDSKTRVLERGATALGWKTFPIPLLINTVPRGERDSCVQCKYCVGFACPTNAKNGTQNTMIPRAAATGNCDIVSQAMTERIETDTQGNAIGVSYFAQENGQTMHHTARARVVVASAGAIESARLLLNSRSPHHPQGLGNTHDMVGRNLQGHYYPGASGICEETVFDGVGPGVTIATNQFNHGNAGVIGGGMLADDFIKPPIDFWFTSLPPDMPRWGLQSKQWMRDNFTRVLHIKGPVQEIPCPDGRVQVDDTVRDRWGIPVARLSGATHSATVDTAEFMRERAEQWLRACGCTKVWSHRRGLSLSGGQHQAGTCRMGRDAKDSVTDFYGRVHGHDNLFVVDGSLHVTNGGFNPVLTIMALAFRSAEHIAKSL
ncbi:MAG TPA: GMC family oxidoreductase [Abditibacteriaceae bacterium]|jgi:choline dehydrogenase-like flavoprotein